MKDKADSFLITKQEYAILCVFNTLATKMISNKTGDSTEKILRVLSALSSHELNRNPEIIEKAFQRRLEHLKHYQEEE